MPMSGQVQDAKCAFVRIALFILWPCAPIDKENEHDERPETTETYEDLQPGAIS